MKFWTLERKKEVYRELRNAERAGRLETAATSLAERMDRPVEEVQMVYSKAKEALGA